MLHRLMVAGLMALAIATLTARTDVSARSADDGYEMWPDCGQPPDDPYFLPIYLAYEPQGFVDLRKSKHLGDKSYLAMQYTRDKDFGSVPAVAGRWYGGMGIDRWPLGTIDPARQLASFRVTAWEVDGNVHPVNPLCVLTWETEDLAFGLYNVWVRFSEPGVHTVKIFGRQIADFTFLAPFVLAAADPFEGRRIFLAGEPVGDVIDDQFVHSYVLNVGRRDDDGGGGQRP